jgi:mannose-6-phosphate isomerase
MTFPPPQPVSFVPELHPRPWGGRRLAELGKALPPDVPIGESWELVSLPGHESRVREGPLAGRTLAELLAHWGSDLLGTAPLADGRFPLLVKFLDAAANLSIQVHPRPARDTDTWEPGVKHEAWYVVSATPGAGLYLGLKHGVTASDLARAAGTAALVDLLRFWPAEPGQCFNIPSGTVHALGAGLVVAEVQTPSDVTYRMYDWDRRDAHGQPRPLHIAEALANTRMYVPDGVLRPTIPTVESGVARCVACPAFAVDRLEVSAGRSEPFAPVGRMHVWIVTRGRGVLGSGDTAVRLAPGTVVLLPAGMPPAALHTAAPTTILDVKVVAAVERPGGGRDS